MDNPEKPVPPSNGNSALGMLTLGPTDKSIICIIDDSVAPPVVTVALQNIDDRRVIVGALYGALGSMLQQLIETQNQESRIVKVPPGAHLPPAPPRFRK